MSPSGRRRNRLKRRNNAGVCPTTSNKGGAIAPTADATALRRSRSTHQILTPIETCAPKTDPPAQRNFSRRRPGFGERHPLQASRDLDQRVTTSATGIGTCLRDRRGAMGIGDWNRRDDSALPVATPVRHTPYRSAKPLHWEPETSRTLRGRIPGLDRDEAKLLERTCGDQQNSALR